MRHWFTKADAPIRRNFVKRFDPLHWTVDFPRGTIASLVTAPDGHGLDVTAEFLRRGDLVGLIWESEDRHAHPAHARETNRDYRRCTVSFRWQSTGLMPLDAINGPTLTVEGMDLAGAPRSWFVRLWNYAEGDPTDAVVTIDFDDVSGGFNLPADADPVFPERIDRMFISLVPPDYIEESEEIRSAPALGSLTLSDIRCDSSGSVLVINDAVTPEHELRIATAYDDLYHLPPERIVEAIERLGYRKLISHYVGMSHYMALDGAGLVEAARPLNEAALEWHRELARAAAERGYQLIWSLSFELLAMFCPAAWQQRAFDGSPALTAYEPPSVLVSPANGAAIDYLKSVAEVLIDLSVEAGLQPQLQIGEPWWWVTASGAISLYDDTARAVFGGSPIEIADVRGPLTPAQKTLLDDAGAVLASATAEIAAAVKARAAGARVLGLIYLPSVLDPKAPELKRANLPIGWAKPAFDVLQLEDYEWVTSGSGRRAAAFAEAEARLGYLPGDRHYFSGFVATGSDRANWAPILTAAQRAREHGVAEAFLWALPQVLRDGLTVFGEESEVTPFDDVMFPIEIGADASVAPGFSTNIVTSASGYETRNVNWQQARLRFDAGPGVRGDAELESLIDFFRARRGPAVAFRFRDPFDFSSNGMSGTPTPTDQEIGSGDGTTVRFVLIKNYGTGEQRRITRPAVGTVRLAVDGVEQLVGWTLSGLGELMFDDAPAAGATITAGFLFDIPVRFADDRLEINRASFRAGEVPSVPLVEVREA